MVADVDVGGPLGHGSLGALEPWPLLTNVRDARSLDFQMEPPSPPLPQLCHDTMCTIHRHNQAATLANGGLSSFSSAPGGGRASSQPSPLPSPPSSQISLDEDPPHRPRRTLTSSLRRRSRRRALDRCRNDAEPAATSTAPTRPSSAARSGDCGRSFITSRLSQPFSQPATHIINRDAVAAGDKRFIKLAASADANKRCPSTQSSIVRPRRRHEPGPSAPARRGRVGAEQRLHGRHGDDDDGGGAGGLDAARAAGRHGWAVPRRFGAWSGAAGREATCQQDHHDQGGRWRGPRCVVGARADADADSVGVARGRHARRTRHRGAGGETMSLACAGPTDASAEEVGEDEEMAFPEDMGRYGSADDDDDEDTGDVYSDFGAIFGGPREGDFSDDDEHSYEECLDELDGISWVGR
ncbi:predicted protein [Verticillium alfalfae VaMs.102]|uniref:Predicted protein n=1 Tax=Verticillium alfalfae (strain VaMs.102 / ATCC MYA-4576 / FGSC 10136) TaxID=526221 RepID=C9SSC5_VERA1|nr:predicted protein [Verticillium alfalfae VaMs.102]EEY21690.1 predicted protein [Verticillium alfalfae VaMs.102]